MIEDLKHIVYNAVIEANRKLTPGEVEKAVAKACGVDRKTVKLTINGLVSLGELSYTYVYGTSFLEKSFDRPVRVSKRIVIKPLDKVYQPQGEEVVLSIAGGAAFGNGAHPSTCLALRALDSVLCDSGSLRGKTPLTGLDVGTGTGILAIAMARLGVQKIVATDIDPCAVSEATHNILANNLNEQITVSSTPLERIPTCFSVILANLAFPTLRSLSPLLSEKLEQDGILILSGFKEPASRELGRSYTEQGLSLVRKDTERGWMCLTFCKMEQ
jgi:ribosomal protein L11 methyltransferase